MMDNNHKKTMHRTGTVDLPEDITLEILTKLPPKSLLCFKSVCKHWRSLISGSNFIKLHLRRGIQQDSANLLVSTYRYSPTKSFYGWTSHLYGIQGSNLLGQAIELKVSTDFYQLIGSSHGLVCYKTATDIYVLNPSTRKCKQILNLEMDYGRCIFGFAYDTSIDDYLFVRGKGSFIWVYSLKRSLCLKRFEIPGITLVEYYPAIEVPAIYFKDSLHWLADKTQQKKVIILTFHITEKVIGELSLPSVVDTDSYIKTGIFEGQLCILCHGCSPGYDMSIWQMKSYGCADSWSRIYSVDQCRLQDCSMREPFTLLYISKSGEIIMDNGSKLVAYDPKKNTFRDFRDITIQGIQNDLINRSQTIMTYVPSLVPLNFGTLADESETSEGL